MRKKLTLNQVPLKSKRILTKDVRKNSGFADNDLYMCGFLVWSICADKKSREKT